jgi:MYXO-CTERM domain-containing protein
MLNLSARRLHGLLFVLLCLVGAPLAAQYTFPTFTSTSGNDFIQSITIGPWTHGMTYLGNSSQYNPGIGPGTLQGGVQYTVSLTNNPTYTQSVTLFIDYDGNGNYTGANEIVGTIVLTAGETNSFNFVVPLTVPSGVTRMRLMNSFGSTASILPHDPTGSYSWGQCEDFDVTINNGPLFTASATAGTRPLVAPNEQGPGGDGFHAGTFTIASNNEAGAELLQIELTASGTGDDSADFSEVAIYRSSGGTGYDPVNDHFVGSITAFSANDGSDMISVAASEQAFPINTTRTYFIVVKMSGSGVPTDTYDFQVTDIEVNTGTFAIGMPTTVMLGVQIEAPQFTVASVPGAAVEVYADEQGPGGNGLQAASFTIASNHLPGATLESITIRPSGSGNDATAYDEVAVYRSSGGATFDHATDVLIGSITAFPGNNTEATFTVTGAERDFSTNQTRTYFIVVKFNGTAAGGTIFNYRVQSIGVTNTLIAGTPSTVMDGVEIRRPTFTVTDTSPVQQTVIVGADDVVVQTFSIEYASGPDNLMTSLSIRGLGSGDEVNDVADVRLYHDVNANGQLDAGDVLIDSGTYTINNGILTFDTLAQPAFVAPATRHYLVVYDFETSAADAATFQTYVQAATAQLGGSQFNGIPAPDTNGAPGVAINANILQVSLNGPNTALSVPSMSIGATGSGELLADISITAPANHAWTLTDLTFVAGGTGNANTAFVEIGLYEDSGSGTWDGPVFDPLASDLQSSFSAGTFEVTLALNNDVLNPGQTRRFFLVAKLGGAATTGQTFNARLEAMTATTGTASNIVGVPTLNSNALIIASSALSVMRGPEQPLSITEVAGAATRVLGQVRLAATNDDIQVQGLTFTTGGNGNWTTDIASGNGFQLWVDNGDGMFDDTTDTLIFQGSGAAQVNATFTSTLTVPVSQHRDIWVVLQTTANAGMGAITTPVTFNARIDNASHVAVTGGVPVLVSSAQSPQTPTLGLIDFQVTGFTPVEDDAAGGAAITVNGSGFMMPFEVRIGGVLAMGTPNITGGTQVTGLTVPPGMGEDLPITIRSGELPMQTLTTTFTYPGTGGGNGNGGGGGGSSSDSGGCSTDGGSTYWLLALLMALGALALRPRRANA